MAKVAGKWIDLVRVQEVPSGTVNGSNTTFTLSQTPTSSSDVTLYQNGLVLKQAAGAGNYTVSGTTITMGTAPANGQELYAEYTRK